MIDRAPQQRFGWLLVLLLSASILFAVVSGRSYLRGLREEFIEGEQEQLTAVVDLKVHQLAIWRDERMADALHLRDTLRICPEAWGFLSGVRTETNREVTRTLIASMQQHFGYSSVVVVDSSGTIQLAHPPAGHDFHPADRQVMAGAMRAGNVDFSNLHDHDHDQLEHLDIIVPAGERNASGMPGAVVLRLEASRFLNQLVQSWPGPGRTAECLLARREGNDVLYLSELRHRQKAAAPDMSLATATGALGPMLGHKGLWQGYDYRDKPVFAVSKPVPGFAWYLVAKVDQSEVRSRFLASSWHIGVVLGLSVFSVALVMAFLWHWRSYHLLRKQLHDESERKALADRVVYLYEQANDMILLTDQAGLVLEANDRALRTYEFSKPELRQINLLDLHEETARPECSRVIGNSAVREGTIYESVHQRKNGSRFPVEVSYRLVEIGGQGHGLVFIRDISERKRAENELRASLREKEVLLKEVHHRVKNNLQIVASLLNLQAARTADPAPLNSLLETQSRVRSMALLHETLYRSDSFAEVNFARYAEQVCAQAFRAFGFDSSRVKLLVQVEDVRIGLEEAVPCGLIINELVTNALKHAFPNGRSGQICVTLKQTPDSRIHLRVQDNGVGAADPAEGEGQGSLGLRLVHILTEQLHGTLNQSVESGVTFRITFPGASLHLAST